MVKSFYETEIVQSFLKNLQNYYQIKKKNTKFIFQAMEEMYG